MMTAVVVAGVLSAFAVPLGLSSVTAQRLGAAVEAMSRDVERARLMALERNATVTVRCDSPGTYTAAGKMRRLPEGVHFSDGSADSVVFGRLGAVSDGLAKSFVLASVSGQSAEVVIGPAGSVEVRR